MIKRKIVLASVALIITLTVFCKSVYAAPFVNDTFTDTTSTLLENHTGETGATWTEHPSFASIGSIVIDSANRARGTGGLNLYYASGTPATADYDVQATVTSVQPYSDSTGVAGRMSSTAVTMYWFGYDNPTSQYQLYRFVNGGGFLMASFTEPFGSSGTSHVLKLSMRGNFISGYVDGVLTVSAADTQISTVGSAGILTMGGAPDSNGLHLDDFSATDNTNATTYTLDGPTSGPVNSASSNFTITPNGPYTGTITPASTGPGTFSPSSLTWSGDSSSKTFTYTSSSVVASPYLITTANSTNLADPVAIHYAVSPVVISVNNPSLYWSRDNVYVNGSSYALMINPGSYLKTNFSGTSAIINIDVSALVSAAVTTVNYPIVAYQIDGGSLTNVQLTPTTNAINIEHLSSGAHTLRFVYVSTYDNTDIWNTPVAAVKVTGIMIDNGANISTPTVLPKLLRVDGDSITEGLRVIDITDKPSGNSAVLAFPHLLASLLNSEVTQIGYGSQGWIHAGQANIPSYVNAADYYYNGASRLTDGVLPNPPDYWLIVHGQNDGLSDVSASIETRMEQARIEAGSATQIFIVVPFAGADRVNITAGYTAYTVAHPSDHNVHLIDLGSISYTAADGVHPDAAGHVVIANALYAAINSDLSSISASPTSITQNTSGTISLVGVNTAWTAGTPGTPTFILSGGTGASISAQTIVDTTHATLTINAGSTPGTLTITDPTGGATTTVTVTADTTAPILSAISSGTPGQHSATITWTTDKSSNSQIFYGTTDSYGSSTTLDTNRVTSHSVAIGSLNANTIYHYQIRSIDISGNSVTSPDQMFTTAATVPGAPTAVTAVAASGQATVSFTSPGSNGGSAITSYTATSTPGNIIANGSSSPIIVTGLTNGTSYTFTVTATNNAGTGTASASSESVTPIAIITYTSSSISGGGASVKNTPTTQCMPGDLFNTSTGALCTTINKTPSVDTKVLINKITTNLSMGAKSIQVSLLQHYLNTHGFPVSLIGTGSLGNETNYFGSATKKALARFQVSNGIKPASGSLNTATRKYITAHS